MQSSFCDRIRQLSDDINSQGGEDWPGGKGARRRGHEEDGGGDGDNDFSNPPSSSTSQAGERYGSKRWTAYQKTTKTKEVELFKQRKTLPKLTLGPNWRTMQPAL
eukprot:2315078-Amphidinium_carterae.1